MSELNANLTRSEVRRALLATPGSISELARQLGVSKTAVSLVLKGRSKSARIMAAAEVMARSLMAASEKAA